MIEIPPGGRLVLTNTEEGLDFSGSHDVAFEFNDFYRLKDGTVVIMERMWDERWQTEQA